MSEIEKIAKQIITKGKGILAADESTGTMTKRLSSVNVESTAENRLKFRETLFSSKGMENFIGGVILFDETIKQSAISGKSIPELIQTLYKERVFTKFASDYGYKKGLSIPIELNKRIINDAIFLKIYIQ